MTVGIIKNIAILGGGLMGCGIAQVFSASSNYVITIYEKFTTEAIVRERINDNLNVFVQHDIYSKEQAEGIARRIRIEKDMEKAVKEAQLVIECVPEIMDLKQRIMEELETYCSSETIFATNTSVMSITEIGSKVKKKDRVVGTHFWNPPYLIPLVEVVKTEDTSEATMGTVMALLKEVGKHPIRVAKDVPGFVANRLQHALWREAISIVEHGIADAITVDEAIKMSFGMRLPVLGPLETADMVGTDLTLSIHQYILPYLENSREPSSLLAEKVEKGDLGFKTGQGFMTWSKKDIDQSRTALSEYLIKRIYQSK